MKDFSEQLNHAGLKATIQRLAILKYIGSAGHSSIDDIYENIIREHPSISLATVYKNIQMLIEADILTEVPLTGSKSKYEIKKEEHMHLVCQVCGSMEDRVLDKAGQACIVSLVPMESFDTKFSQLNFYGICKGCQEDSTQSA